MRFTRCIHLATGCIRAVVLLVTDPSAMHGVLNGTLRGLSISYVPRREKVDEGIIKVDDFELCEVSLCAQPANKDCFIRVCQEVRLKP